MNPFPAFAAFLAAALLAACATAPAPEPGPFYYVIRHLQKAEGPDPGLTEAGQRNAARLPDLIADAPPRAVYASTTRRARETAEPVAQRYRLSIKEYDPANTPALLARVKATGKFAGANLRRMTIGFNGT